MPNNPITVTMTFPDQWLEASHLKVGTAPGDQLSLVHEPNGSPRTRRLDFFTRWNGNHQVLTYKVYDTEAAQHRIDLLQTALCECRREIGDLLGGPREVAHERFEDVLDRARARIRTGEERTDVHVLMRRLVLW